MIDVRNAYESAIGHFAPPEGGATLLDPKMRNSREFPKWLADEKTKEALSGKKVLMYCTGGIRCERATALLDEMVKADPTFRISDITMVRGGVERYMRTFPEGGFWKGKNYLFDRRLEQVPEAKSSAALEGDVESWCAVCAAPWAAYRGQFKCAGRLPPPAGVCAVPVIVSSPRYGARVFVFPPHSRGHGLDCTQLYSEGVSCVRLVHCIRVPSLCMHAPTLVDSCRRCATAAATPPPPTRPACAARSARKAMSPPRRCQRL